MLSERLSGALSLILGLEYVKGEPVNKFVSFADDGVIFWGGCQGSDCGSGCDDGGDNSEELFFVFN